jgi:chemotaxis protein CheD
MKPRFRAPTPATTPAAGRASAAGGQKPSGPVKIVNIHIGQHHVSGLQDVEIRTVLGSCIGACIRDPKLGVGGMNHFMLPGKAGATDPDASSEMRYGQFAMERLINDLLTLGARRERLEVKLFGGANTLNTGMRIGDRNVAFVRRFLLLEGMAIAAEDLGGNVGRRIHYNPVTGQVMRLRLDPTRERMLFTREVHFSQSLVPQSIEGSVELFE